MRAETVFCRGRESQSWRVVTESELKELDVEQLPFIFEMRKENNVPDEDKKAIEGPWCNRWLLRGKNEQVDYRLTDGYVKWNDNTGWKPYLYASATEAEMAEAKIREWQYQFPLTVPLRWRVRLLDKAVLALAVDAVLLSLENWKGWRVLVRRYKTVWFYFSLIERNCRMYPQYDNYGLALPLAKITEKVFRDMVGENLPDIILREMLHFAGKHFAEVYGFLPATQSSVPGLKRLDYFLQRPLAPHVAMLAEYLGDIDLEILFPKEECVRFKELCKILKIPAWPSLSKAFATSAYPVLVSLLLHRYGFTKPDIIAGFYGATRIGDVDITKGISFLETKIRKKSKLEKLYPWMYSNADDKYEMFLPMLCRDVIKEYGEKYAAVRLREWSKWSWDAKQQKIKTILFNHYKMLPLEIKKLAMQKSWDDNLLDFMVDKMASPHFSDQYFYGACGRMKRRYNYNWRLFSWECKINGYIFRLIPNKEIMYRLERDMNARAGEFECWDSRGKMAYISVYRKGKAKGLIRIDGKNIAKSYRAEMSRKEQREFDEVLAYWYIRNRLLAEKKDKSYLAEIVQQAVNKKGVTFKEKPVSTTYKKSYSEMNLQELINLPDTFIRHGYYTALYTRIREVLPAPKVKPPAWLTFPDELAYLRFHLPIAERIYTAAYKGIREAQCVMAKMYFDEDYLPHCEQYRWRWKCYSLGIEIDKVIKSRNFPELGASEVLRRWAVVMAAQAEDEKLWRMALEKYFPEKTK